MINLSKNEIADLLTFLNRIPLTQGNSIGEARTLVNIVNKLESSIESTISVRGDETVKG